MISVTILMVGDVTVGPILAESCEVLENGILVRVSSTQMKIFPMVHCYEYTIDHMSSPGDES